MIKEQLAKAILVAVVTTIGINVVMLMNGDSFSLFKTGLYAVVAFVTDYIFSCIFSRK